MSRVLRQRPEFEATIPSPRAPGLATRTILAALVIACALAVSGVESVHNNPVASLSIPVGDAPSAVAVNSTLNRIYVTNSGSNTLSVIDGSTHTVIATLTLPAGSQPSSVAVNHTTGRIYVSNKGTHTLSVFESNNTPVATVTGLGGPHDVAVNETTNRVFVTNEFSGIVTVVDGATNGIIAHIGVGDQPRGIAVNKTTNRVYVANYYPQGTVSVIDGYTLSVVATIDTQDQAFDLPADVAVDESTNRVYVVGGYNAEVIDGNTNAIAGEIDLFIGGQRYFGADSIVVDSTAGRIYIAGWNDGASVAVVDAADNSVTGYVDLLGWAGGLSIAQNTQSDQVYVGESGSDSVVLVEDDGDADGVGDTVDNCPGVSNAAQVDSDSDGLQTAPIIAR